MMWWGRYENYAKALYVTNNGRTIPGVISCYAEEDGLYYRGESQVGFDMAFVYFSSNRDRYNWTDDS